MFSNGHHGSEDVKLSSKQINKDILGQSVNYDKNVHRRKPMLQQYDIAYEPLKEQRML